MSLFRDVKKVNDALSYEHTNNGQSDGTSGEADLLGQFVDQVKPDASAHVEPVMLCRQANLFGDCIAFKRCSGWEIPYPYWLVVHHMVNLMTRPGYIRLIAENQDCQSLLITRPLFSTIIWSISHSELTLTLSLSSIINYHHLSASDCLVIKHSPRITE